VVPNSIRVFVCSMIGGLIAVGPAIVAAQTNRSRESSLRERIAGKVARDAAPDIRYIDLDELLGDQRDANLHPSKILGDDAWTFQTLPSGLIYKSYLAGVKESRLSAHVIYDRSALDRNDALWDATLGSRVGLFRYGTRDSLMPQGFQIDVEGSAQVRLDLPEGVDVRSVDFRGGLPITFGFGRHQTKFAYYHISSHLADEFVLKNPGFRRLNFVRDVLVLGHAYYLTDDVRIYAEAGWAFYSDVSEPWEFQFGLDYAPLMPTGPRGAPFFAINGHLREELNFSGTLTVQAGWAWRADQHGHLLRIGLHYLNGGSNQFEFFDFHEQQIGCGVWYDF
jgi:hypothetical protein